MSKTLRSLATLLLAVSLAAAPACTASAPPSGLSPITVPAEDIAVEARMTVREATAIAETQLEGLNEADYDLFTTAFDDAMRAAITPERFASFREQAATFGRFEAIESVRVAPGTVEGTVRFYFVTRFEAETLVWVLVFRTDGDEVVGALLGTIAS